MPETKCEICGKRVDIETTLYKLKHKRKICCFCSQKCKTKWMEKKGIPDMR